MAELKLLVQISLLVAIATFVSGEFVITTGGNYSISNNGVTWLQSAPSYFYGNGKRYSTSDGTLGRPNTTYSQSGLDKLGPWQNMYWNYRADNLSFQATIKTYQTDQLPLVMFTQKYLNETTGARSPNSNFTISGFPSFYVRDLNDTVGYLSFGGQMMGDFNKKMGIWGPETLDVNGGLIGGPLVLFDRDGNTILIQAFTNFMAVSMYYDSVTSTVNWGIMGDVDTVPAGFEITVVLHASDKGINKAFEDLGMRMRYWYDKTDYYKKLDQTLNYLGYWTDNGAYYYYHTENNVTDYEQTLIDVKAYSDQMGVPYKYMQLDSWWYYKGGLNGVTSWSAMPSVFPHGLQFLHKKIGLPIAAHNRYWSRNATYAKQNGGKYNFVVGDLISLPDDQSFWDDFFKKAKGWGLILYEQDWLNAQLLGLEALQNNLELGQRWLEQMGKGAQKNGMTIQYCMSLPREALQSLTVPTVTQARASDDYQLLDDQWKIGITSLFAYSLGLAPSKDTFWTTEIQPGNPYDRKNGSHTTPGDVSRNKNATEPYPMIQTLVAVLSTGPVGPGDRINGTDKDLLMRCCNEDGLILKPSRPATAVDDQIIEAAFQDGSGPDGEVWTTYTQFDDVHLRFGIIFAANTSTPYNITRRAADVITYTDEYSRSKIFLANDTSTMEDFDDQHPFSIPACSLDDDPYYCLYYTSPVITVGATDVVIIGDLNKWVPMSPQRIFKIWVTGDAVALTLRGKPSEEVTLSYAIDGNVTSESKTSSPSGCSNFLLHEKSGTSFTFPPSMDCAWEVTTTVAPPTPPATTPTTTPTPRPTTSMTTKTPTTPKTKTTTPSGSTMLTGLVSSVVAALMVIKVLH
ncbi:uncharacterized protein [Haliotis cracherodii]|uniref:uncharacterized protein n=1 Tax=Haliotis cracherodii TaxID=6455 RepID=UPI0039E97FFB